MLFAPDAFTAVHREAQRIHDTTGIEYLTALKQAEATIVAERRARGLRE